MGRASIHFAIAGPSRSRAVGSGAHAQPSGSRCAAAGQQTPAGSGMCTTACEEGSCGGSCGFIFSAVDNPAGLGLGFGLGGDSKLIRGGPLEDWPWAAKTCCVRRLGRVSKPIPQRHWPVIDDPIPEIYQRRFATQIGGRGRGRWPCYYCHRLQRNGHHRRDWRLKYVSIAVGRRRRDIFEDGGDFGAAARDSKADMRDWMVVEGIRVAQDPSAALSSASIIHHVRSICRGWYVLFAPHRIPADPARLLSNPNRHCKHFCAPI